ncbi:SdpI/YhfL protein family protein [Peptostreptococcaceae bacterium pGA-8]|nr:SdpI/YhfL protein family protein [Peptostreptococcaceae bacterium pGA-8]
MKNKKWYLIFILLSFSVTIYSISKSIYIDDIYGLYIYPIVISVLSIAIEIFGNKLAESNKIPKKIILPIAMGIPILFTISQYGKYILTSENEFSYEKIIHVLVALIVIIVGNYLPKTKPSRFVGLKFFWLLDKPSIWFKVHRLAGYLWIMSGVLLLSFGLTDSWLCLIAYALLLYVIPLIYSLLLISKERKGLK